jgi:hypothetical protein
MSGIQQMLTGGTYKPAPPTTIGQAYGGGYYAGQISTTANGVATHYLIVSPKATGEASGKAWGLNGVTTGLVSVINGPTNTTSLAALGSSYQAAVFCNNLNNSGGLNGYTDWYLPAQNELEVLYYFLKPTTNPNASYAISGSNANAVSPEPINTDYTTGSPAQTSAVNFMVGGTEALTADGNWSSSERSTNQSWAQGFYDGYQFSNSKTGGYYVRAVRRVPV